MATESLPSSFRDPSGFLFSHKDLIYRQVNASYRENYDHLMSSGLYETLVEADLLIRHEEVDVEGPNPGLAYKVIYPEQIPFVSYPYEWTFSQLKHAALTTLEIQKKAFDLGMSLKDSNAYNIQFVKGKPLLIDTLSFEKYQEGQPWVAYRQFCQHFLAPLTLMSYKDIRLNQLSRIYLDGVPLDLASSLLPVSTCFRFSLLTHIHLHAKSQRRFAKRHFNAGRRKFSSLSFLGLIDNLESATRKLKWQPRGTEWADYYENTNYALDALEEKKQVVARFVKQIRPENIWDLGANAGVFSRIGSDQRIPTLSFDIDPAAVEKNYLACVENGEDHLLPLLLDLTNPSPNLGWENQERMSFLERGPSDMALALAMIHHLAISNNVPFDGIAKFFHRICNTLVIEFVPKSDSQVERLLQTREDIFPNYSQPAFESEFLRYFSITEVIKLRNSDRVLYLMNKREKV